MTSTPFNVGLTDNTRSSSRVLRPPGGGHTDIFGGTEPEPVRGRRFVPSAITPSLTEEPAKPTNGTEEASQNGRAAEPQPEKQAQPEPIHESPKPESPKQAETPKQAESPAKIESPAKVDSPVKTDNAVPEPAKAEPPRRVRVPPGGFSSGLCNPTNIVSSNENQKRMEGGGRQSRLLGRLLGKLRGEHRYSTLDKNFSFTSTVESTGCGSTTNDEDDSDAPAQVASGTSAPIDDGQFAANIDLRYGGQYLTPEQLPEFCEQLHHLVEVIRNIQSYSKITGEYPSDMERRLEQEAREVAALAAEARNARDVVTRTRAQRRAVRAFKKHLVAHLASLRETEVRELESTVRLSDRKLFKSWEALKDSTDPKMFDPLLEEIRNKQAALECLVRLIDCRKSAIARSSLPPQPLPPPQPHDNDEESSTTANGRRRQEGRRSSSKRRRKEATREPRSVPLSSEPSRHGPPPQVSVYIQGGEYAARGRVGSAGAVALAPLQLPSNGSGRDILYFTTN